MLLRIFGIPVQLVVGPGTTEDQIAFRRAPSWAGKSGEELAAALSGPQVRALVEMAGWAETNLEGVTGVTTLNGRRVPRSAAQMRAQYKDEDFGGMSTQELKEARKAKRTSIDDLQSAAREIGKI